MKSIDKTYIICKCTYSNLIKDIDLFLNYINGKNQNIVIVDDICNAAIHSKQLKKTIESSNELIIFACYERTIRSLFQQYAIKLPKKHNIVNLQQISIDQFKKYFDDYNAGEQLITQINKSNYWIPWYPIIDDTRCSNCKQCVSFCLFGVYTIENSKVKVSKPMNCKNNCPACARICPQAAIIFPKSNEIGINGDIINEGNLNSRIKIDVDKMFNEDITKVLRKRKLRKTKALIKESEMSKALNERAEFKKKNKSDDI